MTESEEETKQAHSSLMDDWSLHKSLFLNENPVVSQKLFSTNNNTKQHVLWCSDYNNTITTFSWTTNKSVQCVRVIERDTKCRGTTEKTDRFNCALPYWILNSGFLWVCPSYTSVQYATMGMYYRSIQT